MLPLVTDAISRVWPADVSLTLAGRAWSRPSASSTNHVRAGASAAWARHDITTALNSATRLSWGCTENTGSPGDESEASVSVSPLLLADSLTCTDQLTTDRATDWLLTSWLNYRMIDWLACRDGLTYRLADWLTDRLTTDRPTDWLDEVPND